MTLKDGEKVFALLKDPQAGAFFVEAYIVFNGIENVLYNKDYWDKIGFTTQPIKSFNVGIADYYPLVITTLKYDDPACKSSTQVYRYVDVLDVVRADEEIKKYSTEVVEYWNEVYSRVRLKRI